MYLKYLVKIGVVPESAIVGRLGVGTFTRTGAAISISYLDENKDEILDALEDKFANIDPEEVFRILEQGSILAAYHGLVEVQSEAVQRFIHVVRNVPHSVQCMILGRHEHVEDTRNRLLN